MSDSHAEKQSIPDGSASASSTSLASKRHWYFSPLTSAVILGLCNFCAPGLWGAMNSLGAGGQATPWLVNSANSLTFCLMIVTAFLTSTITDRVGVNAAVFLGGIGFAPYCAGLYLNNVRGTEWLVLVGAATCGLSAGLFWGVEAAVALAYPEAWRKGRFLGIWLSFRVAGQIVGGAINLGLNADRSEAGAVNPKVYIIFMSLTAAGPFVRPHVLLSSLTAARLSPPASPPDPAPRQQTSPSVHRHYHPREYPRDRSRLPHQRVPPPHPPHRTGGISRVVHEHIPRHKL